VKEGILSLNPEVRYGVATVIEVRAVASIAEGGAGKLKAEPVPSPDSAPRAGRYPLSMRVLHWLMAAIIIVLLVAGITMVRLDDQVPAKFQVLFPWHKSFGLLAFILLVIRLWVRARNRVPALPEGISGWERKAVRAGSFLFYALMIFVPCMGYALSSTYTQSDGEFFFGVNLPELLPKNDAQYEVFWLLHRIGAFVLLGLLVLHILGALKHRFLDRNRANDVLSRMT
jgi:cytochrome b561